ncbi:MAG TPA: sugar phosphate nucleotidyltransferase [Rubricoccaceae bacterium]|nr:sugar phosphate nucleotidyltransferase [Rubricoccaceae bacterium]
MTRSVNLPITKAFVYAAGYGTRLRPYTLATPKPMLDVLGRPLVEYVLCYLARAGVRHVTVNAAWLADAFDVLPARGRALGLDVAVSRQAEPYEHGGDLAAATAFLGALGDDERFLAVNGDTVFWLDPGALARAATRVSAEAPLLILGFPTAASPLRVRGGRLVGIGDHRYAAGEPDAHLDDFGVRVFHASVRRHLPAPGTTQSLHGPNGLIARLYAAGCEVLVEPVEGYERVEVGTVADYEGRESNEALRRLARRLCG